MDNLRELRIALVEAERVLREAKDHYIGIKALCEHHATEGGHASGKNADERERNMTLYLGTHETYQNACKALRRAEHSRDRAEAILESAKDARRKWEWDIRSKLADGLFRQGVQSDHSDPADDGAWEDSADEYITRVAVASQGDLARRVSYSDDWWNNLPKAETDDLDF